MFTNDFSEARHPEMLEDMIAVGPNADALQKYPKYENDYIERKKTSRSKLALSKNKSSEKV